MMSNLQIERAYHGYVDRYRSYEVVIDGECRAELRRGESKTIEADPGEVEVFVKIDWCRSRWVEGAGSTVAHVGKTVWDEAYKTFWCATEMTVHVEAGEECFKSSGEFELNPEEPPSDPPPSGPPPIPSTPKPPPVP